MPLLWIGVLLVLGKWLEISPVAELSWWWVLAPLGAAFIWFEVFESLFGLDKKKKILEMEEMRRIRVEREFNLTNGKNKGKGKIGRVR